MNLGRLRGLDHMGGGGGGTFPHLGWRAHAKSSVSWNVLDVKSASVDMGGGCHGGTSCTYEQKEGGPTLS